MLEVQGVTLEGLWCWPRMLSGIGGAQACFGGSPALAEGACWNCQGGQLLWRGSGAGLKWLPGLAGVTLEGLCCWLKMPAGTGVVGGLFWRSASSAESAGEPRVGQSSASQLDGKSQKRAISAGPAR